MKQREEDEYLLGVCYKPHTVSDTFVVLSLLLLITTL